MILFLFYLNRYSVVLINECIVRCTECDTIVHCFQIWTKLIFICDWFENNYVEITDSLTTETVPFIKLALMLVVYLNYQYIYNYFWTFRCQSPLLNRGNFAFKDRKGVNFTTILLQFVAHSKKERIGTLYIFCPFIVDLRIDHRYTFNGDSPSTILVCIHIFSSVHNDTILSRILF